MQCPTCFNFSHFSNDELLRSSGSRARWARSCVVFRNILVFYREEMLSPAQPPSWRDTSYRLSVTAYSIYLQWSSISGGVLLHPQPEDAPCRGDLRTAVLKTNLIFQYLNLTHGSEIISTFGFRETEMCVKCQFQLYHIYQILCECIHTVDDKIYSS
jgi:hypothetical protein